MDAILQSSLIGFSIGARDNQCLERNLLYSLLYMCRGAVVFMPYIDGRVRAKQKYKIQNSGLGSDPHNHNSPESLKFTEL